MKFIKGKKTSSKKFKLSDEIKEKLIISSSIGMVVLFIILAFLSLIGLLGDLIGPIDYIILAFLSGTGIYGMFRYLEERHKYKMDKIFPDFVRDLSESRRAGMTFTKAIHFASKGNYDILTPEIQKISQQISWGSSVTDALVEFSKRVNTKSIRRTISLIIEASRSGGNVADVLDLAARDARDIQLLEDERRANMSSYVVVIYVGMFVFLAIIAILCTSFIPAMTGEGVGGLASATGAGSTVTTEEINMVFYFATLVQGLGSGIVAGVFEDGKFTSSVKHVFVIVLICWLAFKIMLGV